MLNMPKCWDNIYLSTVKKLSALTIQFNKLILMLTINNVLINENGAKELNSHA